MTNRRTEELGIVGRENVAEVAARNHHVKRTTQPRRRKDVIGDLRNQTTRID